MRARVYEESVIISRLINQYARKLNDFLSKLGTLKHFFSSGSKKNICKISDALKNIYVVIKK